jgi:hypothetical protein
MLQHRHAPGRILSQVSVNYGQHLPNSQLEVDMVGVKKQYGGVQDKEISIRRRRMYFDREKMVYVVCSCVSDSNRSSLGRGGLLPIRLQLVRHRNREQQLV